MLNPFIDLINNIISLINLAIIVWAVIGILIHFDIVNRHSPLIQRVYFTLGRALEPMLKPIRRFLGKILPDLGGIDLSPLVLILLLHFINDAMYSWFYRI